MAFTKDRGVELRFFTHLDLSGITAAKVLIKKGDLTTETLTVTVTDYPNGILQYITSKSDDWLSKVGKWQAQAKVEYSDGCVFHGAVGEFTIAAVLF